MATYDFPYPNQPRLVAAEVQELARQHLAALQQQMQESQEQLKHHINAITDEQAAWTYAGKRAYIELMDGKHDGRILDSESGDETERLMARFLRSSRKFERVAVEEFGDEVWMQLRPKREHS